MFFTAAEQDQPPRPVDRERTTGTPQAVPDDPLFPQLWHLLNTGQDGGTPGIDINVLPAWADYTGAGVRVAVADDGVEYTHPDLAPNADPSRGYNQVPGQSPSNGAPVTEFDGHGTNVAGLIAAAGNDGIGMPGVAYGASISGLRLDFLEQVTQAQDAQVFLRAAAFDIMNNSWGPSLPYSYTPANWGTVHTALKDAAEDGRGGLGTILVFAGGNDYGVNSPDLNLNTANRYTISVGAIDRTGRVADFSESGATLLVVAPGVEVTTTDRVGGLGDSDTDHVSTDGTSFAAPIVSGVVALMLEANPGLGYRDVQEILAYSARQVDADADDAGWFLNAAANWNGGGLHSSNNYGFGLVDARAAVRLAESWIPAARTAANEVSLTGANHTAGDIEDASWGDEAPISGAALERTIEIGGDVGVEWVSLRLRGLHAYIHDLEITIVSPSGTESVIYATERSFLDEDVTDFTFVSNDFWGETAAGTWTVRITDTNPDYTGRVTALDLTVHGSPGMDDQYFYSDTFADLAGAERQVLADTDGGTDTLNAAMLTGAARLDLSGAGSSLLAGRTLTIAADSGIENAIGGDGDDTITGGTTANRLIGARGNDRLDGGAGNDTLSGGRGDDMLTGGAGDDRLDGGDGVDTASYAGAGAGVTVNLLRSGAQATGGAGLDTLVGIENLTGSTHGDHLTGNTGDNRLDGGAGNDTLLGSGGNDILISGRGSNSVDGGSGSDWVLYDWADAAVSVNLLRTTAQNTWGAGIDTLLGVENLLGTRFNDRLTGNIAANTLVGGEGNDTLLGSSGNDTLAGGTGDDYMDAGTGRDAASYADAGSAVTVSLLVTTAQNTGGGGTDTLLGVESLIGSRFADTLTGNSTHNMLEGGDGDDTLDGGLRNDTLTGGAGDDLLLGGSGTDTLTGGEGRDVMWGGGSADIFIFTSLGETGTIALEADIIMDFTNGVDRIDLSGIDADAATDADDAFTTLIGAEDVFDTAGQLKLVNGVLYGNTDEDALPEFAIVLTGVTRIGLPDLLL